MVVAQPLLDDRLLFGTQAELPGATARITDCQHPHRVALSSGTDGTTGAMADEAVEQRSTDDLGSEREGGGDFGASAKDGFLIHLY